MKTVAVLLEDPSVTPPDGGYSGVYAKMMPHFERRGLSACRVSAWDFDEANGTFRRALRYAGGGWERETGCAPDAVWYQNSALAAPTFRVASAFSGRFECPLPFVALARDKYAVARAFPDVSPKTRLASEIVADPDSADGFPGGKVVVKPRFAFGGKGVTLVPKADLRAFLGGIGDASGYVVQEFVDTSAGIPGVAPGVHDLRAFYVDGRLAHYLVRMPKTDDFRCNIGAGGSGETYLPADLPVPASVRDFHQSVAAKCGATGVYGIDCVVAKGGRPMLAEISDCPGLEVFSSDRARSAAVEEATYGSIADLFARLTR